MTYKEKMDKEHPAVDPDYIIFSCPGHYFDDAPSCNNTKCPRIGVPNPGHVTCYNCWTQNIPGSESDDSVKPLVGLGDGDVYSHETIDISEETADESLIDPKKIASRVKDLYMALRDEELNHQEAFEITKIIIAEEVRYGVSRRKDLSD